MCYAGIVRMLVLGSTIPVHNDTRENFTGIVKVVLYLERLVSLMVLIS